jgi:hypothetical protein
MAKKESKNSISEIGIVLLILFLLFIFSIGGFFCYEKFKNSSKSKEPFVELINPDLKIYGPNNSKNYDKHGLLKSTETIGNPNSTYEGPKLAVNRPDHPKWYKDVPEDSPEVLSLYKDAENHRRSSKKYTKVGYEKRQAPKEIFEYLQKIARTTDRTKEGSKNIFSRTSSGPPPYIIAFPEDKKESIAKQMKPILEEWSGIPLEYTCLYGARDYPKDAALRMHCDRDSHIISVIFHIDRSGCNSSSDGESRTNWPLEVIGFDGIKRDIYMEPGEMVLYESSSCPHARETPNPCNSFVNAFLHFHPK